MLFTDEAAELRYRAVPDRYLSFPDVSLDARSYDELEIPWRPCFLVLQLGAESDSRLLSRAGGRYRIGTLLAAWQRILEANHELRVLRADVEALLLRADSGGDSFSCHLVPIDACYALVGRLRQVWRGFDGGTEAHQAMDDFFADVAAKSRPAT